MTLITKDEAQAALQRYHPAFVESIEAGWAASQRLMLQMPPTRIGTQAALVHDAIEAELRLRLGSERSVSLSDPRESRFVIRLREPQLIVSVKKLSEGLTISNYPTWTATRFNSQLELPGLPRGAPRITLGYRQTETRDDLVGIFVALLKGADRQWVYELTRGPTGVASIVPDEQSTFFEPAQLKLKSTRLKGPVERS